MQIVIMGCGRVGSTLARDLDRLGHSVSVIDRNPAAFRRLGSSFGGREVTGTGFSRHTLITAGIQDAGAFAAVSSGDNSNIISARVARETFHVPHVVARIYDPKRAEVYERLGIPTVATVPWTSHRMLAALLGDIYAEEWRDPSGSIAMVQVAIHPGWVTRPLRELEAMTKARTACLTRFGQAMLPSDGLVLQEGDVVHLLVSTDSTESTVNLVSQDPERNF